MSQAFIHCRKAHRRDGKWFHPKSGVEIATDSEHDLFVMWATTPDGQDLISFIVNRPCLEQVQHGIDKALTVDPIIIRKVA